MVSSSPGPAIRLHLLLVSTLLGLATASFAQTSKALFPAATVTIDDVKTAIRSEWVLRQYYEVLPQEDEEWFETLRGSSKVLVSAPHATAQTREGKLKFADAGTGALALSLHNLCDATVIYTTRRSPSDPNFYDDNAYKQKLAELIKELRPRLVIDLHASHWYHPYDIDFGTMHGLSIRGQEAWLRRLTNFLKEAGMEDFSQDFFSAANAQTVTKFAHNAGVPCLQLEINEEWLNFFSYPGMKAAESEPPQSDIADDTLRVDQHGAHRFAQLLEALLRFVDWIDTNEAGNNGAK